MTVPPLGDPLRSPGWLPIASSLAQLAETNAESHWPSLRCDPAIVLELARMGGLTLTGVQLQAIHHGTLLQAFVDRWHDPELGWIDWRELPASSLRSLGLRIAAYSESLAQRTQKTAPESAWCAGLLAPLGWYALLAQGVALFPPGSESGYDPLALARRWMHRWQLPAWLVATTGYLHLPLDAVVRLGGDADLFAIVQTAVFLAQGQDAHLRLAPSAEFVEPSLRRLGLHGGPPQFPDVVPTPEIPDHFHGDPRRIPLLFDWLKTVGEHRRQANLSRAERLEREADELHRLLLEQRSGEALRLRDAKLNALAELAAGAGHEINNPLAVISGHSQYLLSREECPERRQALQAIVRQTQRIHQILNELMLFARPAPPQRQPLDLHAILQAVLLEVRDLADRKRVRLEVHEALQPIALLGDARQIQTALTCLVRNAIEAATEDGWVRIRQLLPESNHLEMVIEDNGPGPEPAQREHIFDPFYSGRTAGRGRGLGLPTAWRLAQAHGGDVRFESLPEGPTRFVLVLPTVSSGEESPIRRCA